MNNNDKSHVKLLRASTSTTSSSNITNSTSNEQSTATATSTIPLNNNISSVHQNNNINNNNNNNNNTPSSVTTISNMKSSPPPPPLTSNSATKCKTTAASSDVVDKSPPPPPPPETAPPLHHQNQRQHHYLYQPGPHHHQSTSSTTTDNSSGSTSTSRNHNSKSSSNNSCGGGASSSMFNNETEEDDVVFNQNTSSGIGITAFTSNSHCQSQWGPLNQSIDQRLEDMTMDEYESFLNVCMKPNSISKTDEQAEMIIQLGRPLKPQPEEPIPPLKNAKFCSSLQSLNNGKGTKTSQQGCSGGVNNCNSSSHGHCRTTGQIMNNNHHCLGNVTTSNSTTNSICNTIDSSTSGSNISNCASSLNRDQQHYYIAGSQRSHQNSHYNSSSSRVPTTSSNSSNVMVNTLNSKECPGGNSSDSVTNNSCSPATATNYINSSSMMTTNSLQQLQNTNSHVMYDAYNSDQNTSTYRNTNLYFTTSRSKAEKIVSVSETEDDVSNSSAVPTIVPTGDTEEIITGDLDDGSNSGSPRCTTPPTILGIRSCFSPTSSTGSSPPSRSRSKEPVATTSNSVISVKPSYQPSCDECNYTLPYYFNGRDGGGAANIPEEYVKDRLRGCAVNEPQPSTSTGITTKSKSPYSLVRDFVGDGTNRSNFEANFVETGSYPYTHYGLNRNVPNSLYRTVREENGVGGVGGSEGASGSHSSGSLGNSSSFRDINPSIDQGRSSTPNQFTLRPGNSVYEIQPAVASTSAAAAVASTSAAAIASTSAAAAINAKKETKQKKKQGKKEKGVSEKASDQIEGFRGGESLDTLLSFIEGGEKVEKVELQTKKQKQQVKKERDLRAKNKGKDVLVKSVSLDDDNSPSVSPSSLKASSSPSVKSSSESVELIENKPEDIQVTLADEQDDAPLLAQLSDLTIKTGQEVSEESNAHLVETKEGRSELLVEPIASTVNSTPSFPNTAELVSGPRKSEPVKPLIATVDDKKAEPTPICSVPQLIPKALSISKSNNSATSSNQKAAQSEDFTVVTNKNRSRKRLEVQEPAERFPNRLGLGKALRDRHHRGREFRNFRGFFKQNNTYDRRKSVGSVPGSANGSGSDDDSVRSLPGVNVVNKHLTKIDSEVKQGTEVKSSGPVVINQASYSARTQANLNIGKRNTPGSASADSPNTNPITAVSSSLSKITHTSTQTSPDDKEKRRCEPVIFSDNLHIKPEDIDKELEFGFGVNDLIDPTKTQDTQIAKSADSASASASEAQVDNSSSENSSDNGQSVEKEGVPSTTSSSSSGEENQNISIYQPLIMGTPIMHPTMPHSLPQLVGPNHTFYPHSRTIHPSIYSVPLMHNTPSPQMSIGQPIQAMGHPFSYQQQAPNINAGVMSPPMSLNMSSPTQMHIPTSFAGPSSPFYVGMTAPSGNFPIMQQVTSNEQMQHILQQEHQQLLQQQQQQQQHQVIQLMHQQQQQQQLHHHQQQQQQFIHQHQQQQQQLPLHPYQAQRPNEQGFHPEYMTPQQIQQQMQSIPSNASSGTKTYANVPGLTRNEFVNHSPIQYNQNSFGNKPHQEPPTQNERFEREYIGRRGGMNARRGSRTYFNRGGQNYYQQPRESYNSSSRRGSRQSNGSPVSTSSAETKSVPTASGTSSGDPDYRATKPTATAKSETKPAETKATQTDEWEGAKSVNGDDIAAMYIPPELDENSAAAAMQAFEFMSTASSKVLDSAKRDKAVVHRL